MRTRTLTVVVGGWIVMDGSFDPPAVGEILSARLTFDRTVTLDADDPRVVTVVATAHPSLGLAPVTWQPDGGPRWSTELRGDWWSARWYADRPMTGRVCLTGALYADLVTRTEPVRGRVTRVRTIVAAFRDGPQQSGRVEVPGSARFPDINASPRWFDGPEDRDAPRADGALVDLDLDDVSPATPRPRVVPGAVAAHGDALWVLDRELPVLVRVQMLAGTAVAAEHVLPAPVVDSDSVSRRLIADADGCWVVRDGGTFRVTVQPDGSVRHQILDAEPVRIVAANGAMLLAVGVTMPGLAAVRDVGTQEVVLSDPPARLLSTVAPPIGVALPPMQVVAVASTMDGFRVQLHDPTAPQRFRIVAVALDGTVTPVPDTAPLPRAEPTARVTTTGLRWADATGKVQDVDVNALLGRGF